MHIGILQTGLAPAELEPRFGEYPGMFEALLAGRGFTFDNFAVVNGTFPEGPEAADGWLITGSKHGAYEDHPWIAPLEDLIRAIHAAGRPLIGVCFGHQIIAQALGGRVEKFSDGWSIGPVAYDFPEGPLTLNAWHQDQITELPEGARVIASSDFCRNAALLYGDRIYSVQPHPEYGSDFIGGLIDTRGRGVVPDDQLDEARTRLDTPLDRTALADQFERFFKTGKITA
ncbi:type 1 glutamine amidotransferase [Litorisediminicola beolgyonensis]|uniref:Type 1 glutamine amidotransferase n=1 Tax=Litorisediminicola beolgyonensis TaxID=1173614 RepID=A0ABW3ZIV2_9RHOB